MPPNKEIIIERTQPPATQSLPESAPQDLPTMLPGKLEQPANNELEHEVATDQKQPEETKEPEQQAPTEQAAPTPDGQTNKETQTKSEQIKKPEDAAKPIRPNVRKRAAKPVFNFNQLNSYATALGSSAFKNQGVDRAPTAQDQAILLYQEKVRKHFHENWNNYANTTYYYNLNQSQIFLAITIDKNGRVLKNSSSHNSNNPAILNLLVRILKYCEPFPIIPNHLKLETFDFRLTIHLAQGEFSSGYGYS